VYAYYLVIRQLKQQHTQNELYLTCCKECGIYFFTDPRNKGRKDLRCPFGCRDLHSKHESYIRSKEFYQSPVGKVKKRELNRKRGKACFKQNSSEPLQKSAPPLDNSRTKDDSTLISYLTILIGLLEHRLVSHAEIATLINDMRQRGIERAETYPYIDNKENRQPP
jgi:hypothetical protein